MATQGPLYPTVVTSAAAVAPEDDDAWVNPDNVKIDDGTEAQITASTFDTGDISRRLLTQTYGFTIPTGATIDGVVVEIDRRCFAGSAEDNRVELMDDLGGFGFGNHADTVTAWPATLTVASYGSSSDEWGIALTPTIVNDPDFGVVLSVAATGNNTDIAVDFIRATVHYTDPNITVTPPVASLATATFVSTVTASNHQAVTPITKAASLTTFAPVIKMVVTPPVASLSLSALAPTVAVTDNQSVTPTTAALGTTRFAPIATTTAHQTVVPSLAAISTATFAPIATTTAHQTVVPAKASVTTSAFASTVTASDHKLLTPAVLSAVTATFAPTVTSGPSIVWGVWSETFSNPVNVTIKPKFHYQIIM